MKKAFFILMILTSVFIIIQCDSTSDKADPAAELYGKTWETICLAQGSNSYRFWMTFSSSGGFHRVERYYANTDCFALTGNPDADYNKTFSWIEATADPEIKKLTYIDENDDTVYALYRIENDGTLTFAEDGTVYPADLTGAIEFN